jgi:membrane protein
MSEDTAGPPPPGKWKARADATRERALARAEWAREHLPWGDVVADALERERIAAAGLLSGGLAYRLFFWIVPLGLVFSATLGYWVEADRIGLESAARDFGIGGAVARAAAETVEQEPHSRWYFLVIGAWLLVWFGGGVVRAANVAYAVAWRLRPERVQHQLRAGALFSLGMIALIVVTSGTAALRELTPGPGLVVTLAIVGIYVATLLWVMSLLPSRTDDWRDLVPGAVLIAVGTQLIHLFVALYLAPRLGRSTELYGALGAATVILLWLYLEARLFVGAAFLNACLWERAHPESPDSS